MKPRIQPTNTNSEVTLN